ncbi:sulfatase-like hydrolase/transferase [Maribellus maritimus]|nr:sulfatase-like hydrolase/transferase [Maribellus maritimus]
MADDLGYGDLSGQYGGKSKTPHINSLAQEGMLFTDFHTNGPTCSPTRASLLTGRYPQRLGVETPQSNVLDLPQNQNEITIAEYLHKEGYFTGIIGKWHLGRPQKGSPTKFGFERFIGYYGGDLDYFSKIDRYGRKDWWYNETLLDEEGYVTQLITKYSVQFIKESKNKPFFLYVSHLAVHFPWQDSKDDSLWKRQEGNHYTLANMGLNNKLGPHLPNTIPFVLAEMIEELDESVGEIISALHEFNLDDHTLVFFMSDNGQYINYGEEWPHVGSNGILRGQKGNLWEGGHRVPAIAWWPGKISSMSVSNKTVMSMDILPTVLDLLNISFSTKDSPNLVDGISILPLLLGNKLLKPRLLFWRTPNQKAVRFGDWKLVIGDQADKPELYNLREDIREADDIASLFPEKVYQLKSELEIWEKNVNNN